MTGNSWSAKRNLSARKAHEGFESPVVIINTFLAHHILLGAKLHSRICFENDFGILGICRGTGDKACADTGEVHPSLCYFGLLFAELMLMPNSPSTPPQTTPEYAVEPRPGTNRPLASSSPMFLKRTIMPVRVDLVLCLTPPPGSEPLSWQ